MSAFELDIARFVEKAKDKADLVVRKVSLEMFKRVIQKSPVDTGRFKSNWQAAIGSVPKGTLGLDDSITHKGGRETDRGAAHRFEAAGAASFTRVNQVALNGKAGDVIYLVNNLSYANALEYGHSGQAPSGMVRLSILEWNTVVAKAVAETPK